MNRIELNNLDGIRRPSTVEQEAVVGCIRAEYEKKVRRCGTMSTLFTVLGIMFLYGYTTGGWPSVLIGILFFLFTFLAVREKNIMKSLIRAAEKGDFQVLSGTVYEISSNADFPGMSNVKFMSAGGRKLDGLFRVSSQDLQVGTPLLLVYVQKGIARRELLEMYTPSMLTACR